MRDSILTALYVFLQEVLLEEISWHILHNVLTKVDERFPLHPVSGLTQFFLYDLEEFISAW
jgi:hypothetical protein